MTFKISEKFQVLRFQAQALKETGDFDRALLALNQALVLDHKHAATISQKGELLYEERIFLSLSSKFPSINHQREGNKKVPKKAGKPQQSLREFKKCTALEPWNLKCQIFKSLCNLNTGKFYPGIKDLTQRGTTLSLDINARFLNSF